MLREREDVGDGIKLEDRVEESSGEKYGYIRWFREVDTYYVPREGTCKCGRASINGFNIRKDTNDKTQRPVRFLYGWISLGIIRDNASPGYHTHRGFFSFSFFSCFIFLLFSRFFFFFLFFYFQTISIDTRARTTPPVICSYAQFPAFEWHA